MTAPKKPRRLQYATYFRRAAKRLQAFGWCQGAYQRGFACCALGAMNRAVGDAMLLPGDGEGKWREFFRKAAGLPADALVTDWNDAKGRTQAEVIAAFHRAAKLAGKRLAPAVSR